MAPKGRDDLEETKVIKKTRVRSASIKRKKQSVGDGGEAAATKAPPRKRRSRSAKGNCPSAVVEEVQKVLLELMTASESDSVRVAAAKALIDKISDDEAEADETGHEEQERNEIIAEACSILDALAEAISCRLSGTLKMVEGIKAGTSDAARKMANLVDPCGARVGKNANRG